MKIAFSRTPLLLTLVTASFMAHQAHALDAACERVASASETKLAAPAFHDRKELGGLVHELLAVDGKLYARDAVAGRPPEAWAPSPVTLADIRSAARTYRGLLQSCRGLGSESVDGVVTDIYAFKVKTGGTVADGKVWIGKADGLPYREEAPGMKGTTVYRNLKAPR